MLSLRQVMADEHQGEGGSYLLHPDGRRELIERTDWTPPAPKRKSKPIPADSEDHAEAQE